MKFLRLKKLPEYQIEAPGEVADKIDGGSEECHLCAHPLTKWPFSVLSLQLLYKMC